MSRRATVALTRYKEPDWLVLDTLRGLAAQTGVDLSILFLDQSSSDAIDPAISDIPGGRIERRKIEAQSLLRAAVQNSTTVAAG